MPNGLFPRRYGACSCRTPRIRVGRATCRERMRVSVVDPSFKKNTRTVIGHSRDGVFRELFCLDAADAVEGSHLVLCPTGCSLEDTELVLAEPLASVLYSLELLREKCGAASLLIRGSGTVGILAAKLWPILTGSFAILVSKSEAHARWLRESTRWP